jgi:hypothetical protein
MWQFFGQLLTLAVEKKFGVLFSILNLAGIFTVAYAGKAYVDRKHTEGMEVVGVKIQSLTEGVKDLKDVVKDYNKNTQDLTKSVLKVYEKLGRKGT